MSYIKCYKNRKKGKMQEMGRQTIWKIFLIVLVLCSVIYPPPPVFLKSKVGWGPTNKTANFRLLLVLIA